MCPWMATRLGRGMSCLSLTCCQIRQSSCKGLTGEMRAVYSGGAKGSEGEEVSGVLSGQGLVCGGGRVHSSCSSSGEGCEGDGVVGFLFSRCELLAWVGNVGLIVHLVSCSLKSLGSSNHHQTSGTGGYTSFAFSIQHRGGC
jgi:hypothetical protein